VIKRMRTALPPDVAIWTEYAFTDVASQYADGSLHYYFLDLNQTFARRYRYVLQCDIRQFFPAIDHAILRAILARKLADTIPGVPARYVDDTIDGFESWEAAIGGMPAEPISDETEGSDMLYSSGTTGRPKGIKVPLAGEALGSNPALLALFRTPELPEELLPESLKNQPAPIALMVAQEDVLQNPADVWNVLDNHLTRSYDQAMAVLEGLLAMEGNEEMNAHFKWPDNW